MQEWPAGVVLEKSRLLRDESDAALHSTPKKSSAARRGFGSLVAFLGMLALTPDALLVRWIEREGVHASTLGFWKFTIASVQSLGITCWMSGGVRSVVSGIATAPVHLLLGVVFQCWLTIGWTSSLLLCDTARALALFSLNPFVTAVVSLFVLSEPIPTRTLVALLASCFSISIIFTPEWRAALWPSDDMTAGLAAGTAVGSNAVGNAVGIKADGTLSSVSLWPLFGETLAFFTGCSFAFFITCSRHAALNRPRMPMQSATAFGAMIAAILAMLWSRSSGHPLMMPPACCVLVGVDATCVAFSYVAMAVAAKHVTGPEISLIYILEMIVSPFWVFLFLGSVPSWWTIAGGGMLVATLAAHELSLCVCKATPTLLAGAAAHSEGLLQMTIQRSWRPCKAYQAQPSKADAERSLNYSMARQINFAASVVFVVGCVYLAGAGHAPTWQGHIPMPAPASMLHHERHVRHNATAPLRNRSHAAHTSNPLPRHPSSPMLSHRGRGSP